MSNAVFSRDPTVHEAPQPNGIIHVLSYRRAGETIGWTERSTEAEAVSTYSALVELLLTFIESGTSRRRSDLRPS
jgi:hypothetical protein